MRKIPFIIAGLTILMTISFVLMINSLNIEEEKIKERVGLKVILEKDTLTIVDYSLLKTNYTLSNGTEVSCNLIDKLKTLK